MERALALALLLLFTLLTTEHRPVNGQAFCRSQISLANEACRLRNLPPAPRQQQLNESSSAATATAAAVAKAVEADGAGSGYELVRSSRDEEEEEEGEEEEEDQGEGGSGRRHRRRRHRHNAEGSPDPYDTACCRRLMAIDNSCVCQAMARVPMFMTSVWHIIRLRPVDGCDVSFECPGTFSPLG